MARTDGELDRVLRTGMKVQLELLEAGPAESGTAVLRVRLIGLDRVAGGVGSPKVGAAGREMVSVAHRLEHEPLAQVFYLRGEQVGLYKEGEIPPIPADRIPPEEVKAMVGKYFEEQNP